MSTKELKNRLRELRANKARELGRRKIPQREIADKLGITPAAYASWESGRTRPDISLLRPIADYFDVSIDYLLGRSDRGIVAANKGKTRTGTIWSLRRQPKTENEHLGLEVWRSLGDGKSFETIIRELKIHSRRAVERYFQDVIVGDIIQIDNLSYNENLAGVVKHAFGLKEVIVLPTAAKDEDRPIGYSTFFLGEAAREFFCANVYEGMQVGLAGGYSVSRLVYSLRRGDCRSIDVYPIAINPVTEAVSLNTNSLVGTLAYRHYGYNVRGYMLPYSSPVDWAETKDYHRRFAPTLRLLAKARSVDVAFMGLGIFGRRRAPVDWLGYLLDTKKVGSKKFQGKEIVGDILYHLVDADGHSAIPEINDLMCSISLQDLQELVQMEVPTVAIASRPEKARIAHAAIRGGYINTLIIDDTLAQALLQL